MSDFYLKFLDQEFRGKGAFIIIVLGFVLPWGWGSMKLADSVVRAILGQ